MPEEKKQLTQRSRAAQFVPDTFNADDYTIDVVAATDSPVLQMGWDGPYNEILSMNDGEVRLARLNNGANVLDNHNRYGSVTDSVLGVVKKAWLDGGNLRATLQLSKRPELASFVADVQAGIQRNISINYRVYQVELTTGGEKMDEYRCTDWEPFEISFVSVPADYLSTVRSATDTNNSFNEVLIISNKTRNMPEQKEGATPEVKTPAAPSAGATDNNASTVNVENERKAAAKLERDRSAGILTACRAAGFDQAYAETLINDENLSLDQARAAVIDKMAASQSPAPRSATTAHVTDDEQVKERSAVEYALLHRAAPADYKLSQPNNVASTLAENFRGVSVLDAARILLNQRGITVNTYGKQELFQRSMSTSDFPNLLSNIANKFLRADYQSAQQTFKALAVQQNLPDFKSTNGIQFGGDVVFEEVKEGGEFKYGSLIETKDSWKLSTYGKLLKFTRQMFINDDLGAFVRIAKRIASGAANNESNVFWAIVSANAALGVDSVALFNSAHGNLAGSGAVISTTTMAAARAAMRKQKGLKNEYIQVTPKYIVVGPDQEMAADQLLTNITPNQTGQVNPFPGTGLMKIVEPRLNESSATAWYVWADPSTVEGFTYGYLDGNEGLFTETRYGFEVDGIEMKCRQDFAAKSWDYRGVYKNPGA
jgi:hypothetical protein